MTEDQDNLQQDQNPPQDEAPVTSVPASPEEEPMITPGMNWFVLRVASNKEDSVKETLLRKIKIEGLVHLVNRILVPTEKQKTIKAGKQKILEKKLYPGYVFVEMRLEDDGPLVRSIRSRLQQPKRIPRCRSPAHTHTQSPRASLAA